jgi:glycosyltransferase involved in cell wall biosynthesis
VKKIFVTTSWDDGHKLDKKLADLLLRYNIKGTFYISPKNSEFKEADLLTGNEIIELSKNFEIGGHTLTHPVLSRLEDDVSKSEIIEGKKYLENLTGKEVTSFCYPRGDFSNTHIKILKEAGFRLARTVKRFSFNAGSNLYQIPTTIHAYKHKSDVYSILKLVGFKKFIKAYQNWDYFAIELFESIKKTGGVFHLWGHSWEIESNNDWERLENVLKHISNVENVEYIDNSQLSDLCKVKVAIITPYFPPEGGGLERYALEVSKRLSKNNNLDVFVITSTKCKNNNIEEDVIDGIKIYKLNSDFKISNTPFSFKWFWKIYRIFKLEKPDLINIHMPVPGIGDVAALVAGIKPVVVTYHSGSMRKISSKLNCMVLLYEKILLHLVLKRANKIICSSEYVSKNFLNRYDYKNTVITPGVNFEMFSPSNDLKTDLPTILFVAGLNKSEQHKGLKNLLISIVNIKNSFPNIKLVVVGDGDMREDYEFFVKKNGISGNVDFVGRKLEAELANEYKKAHIFVQPSSNESFSMVVLEAMASGLPVIAINVGGTKNMIDDNQNGYILSNNSPELISEKIISLLNDKNLASKFGENGRQKIIKNFDWQTKSEETSNVIKKLV